MSSKEDNKDEQSTLGEYLSNVRKVKGYTLREVEDATGKEVSNAYLSQLENNYVKKPSPHVLHKLAGVYGVAYEILMERAGYLMGSKDRPVKKREARNKPKFPFDDLTPEEEADLLQYLAFIRSKKKKSE